MSSSSGTRPRVPHHIPGINLSDLDIPLPAHGHHRLLPSKSTPASSYPCEGLSNGKVSSSDSTIQCHQEIINQLRHASTSQADLITELKIAKAVLENDLKHALKDNEAVISTFGVVIHSITRGSTVTPSPQVLAGSTASFSSNEEKLVAQNKEIERYRKENRDLRARVQDLEHAQESCGCARDREDVVEVMDREHNCLRREGGWGERTPETEVCYDGNGKGKMIDTDLPASGSGIPPPFHRKIFKYTDEGGATASQLIGSWATSDSKLPRTLPNSPIIKSVLNPATIDVGMCSLEDFLENDGFPTTITTQNSSPSSDTQPNGLFEDERTIDEQLADYAEANAKFLNMPAPGVLKTGFSLEGAIRGSDYENMKREPVGRNGDWKRLPPTGPAAMPSEYRPRGDGRDGIPDHLKESKFDNQGGLWKDFDNKNDTVQAHARLAGRGEMRYPGFFKHGIQYIPSDTDTNYLRTVLLSNLPLGTSTRDVLARIRGGDVIGVTIHIMGKLIPGSLQARVVFMNEYAAENYVLYATEHPITFGDEDEEQLVADIHLVETPTYPNRQIARLNNQTRCIMIHRLPRSFSLSALEHNLACGNRWRAEGVVEMFIDKHSTLHLEFASVDMAGSAWAILTNWNLYRGLECRWERDPCSGPVEELSEGVKARPPMFPQNWGTKSEESSDDERAGVKEGRKPLAALSNQKVEIPSFSDARLKSLSWADEVNGDFSEGEILPDGDGKLGLGVRLGSKELGGSSKNGEMRELTSTSKPASVSSSLAVSLSSFSDAASVDSQPTIAPAAINGELPILDSSNINTVLSISTSTSIPKSPSADSRKPRVGLAASKYASLVPAFTDSQPSPLQQSSGTMKKFSASPPRVHLHDLIASSSPSSVSVTSPEAVGKKNDGAEFPKSIAGVPESGSEKVEKPKEEPLFKWFQISSKKQRVCSATEDIVKEPVLEAPASCVSEEKRGAETRTEESVVVVSNPDEISLDGDEEDESSRSALGSVPLDLVNKNQLAVRFATREEAMKGCGAAEEDEDSSYASMSTLSAPRTNPAKKIIEVKASVSSFREEVKEGSDGGAEDACAKSYHTVTLDLDAGDEVLEGLIQKKFEGSESRKNASNMASIEGSSTQEGEVCC